MKTHKPYLATDDANLIKLAGKISLVDLASFMQRTQGSLQARAFKLRLSLAFNRPTRPWTPHDKEALENLFYQGMNWKQIGEQLGRSHACVRSMGSKLGMLQNKPWKNAENHYIINNHGKVSVWEMTKFLDRPLASTVNRISRLKEQGML